MQMVAASKLRRAQEAALLPRLYLAAAEDIINELSSSSEATSSGLFIKRKPEKTLTIVVSSDRGLAGAYNSNVIKAVVKHLKDGGRYHKVISIGRYASLFVAKINGKDDDFGIDEVDEIAAYPLTSLNIDIEIAQPVLAETIKLFTEKQVDEVYVAYTRFVSTVKQEPVIEKLLPLSPKDTSSPDGRTFEPSAEALLEFAAKRFVGAKLNQCILESLASEHAARMLAMKNATDNAGDLIDDLTLAFNNARQAGITQDLAEISAGAEAIK
jgi:F-type H+-transporting ATPase subunit gamma